MIIYDTLERSYSRNPDKIALITESGRHTFKDIYRDSLYFSDHLRDMGFVKGERICIYLDNSYESVISIYGSLKAGMIFIPVNPDTKKKKLQHILNNSGSRVIITDKIGCQQLKGIQTEITLVIRGNYEGIERDHIKFDDLITEIPATAGETVIDADIASIIYTSGSTGIPKGVTMTHLSMMTAMRSIISYLGNTPDDIVINVLPISFDYGLYQVLMTVMFGGTLVLEKNFIFFSNVIRRIKEERVTGFPLVPAIAEILLRMDGADDEDLRSLRYITNTAQRLPVRTIKSLMKRFPGVEIFSMYGLTECKRISYLDPSLLGERPDSVGKPMENTEIFLIDEEGRRINTPCSTGELVVRGSNLMKGYWNDPEETDKVLKSGYYPFEKVLLTGDIFSIDEDGFLYFISRKDDVFKIGGEKVSPKEVEEVLLQMRGIREAVLIKKENRILGNSLLLIASVDGDLDERMIKSHCMMNLEKHLVPREIILMESLPKNDNGKIDRSILVERYNGNGED